MAINANLPFKIQRPRVSANALANRDARIDKRDARMRDRMAMENAGQQHQINALALTDAQTESDLLSNRRDAYAGGDVRNTLAASGDWEGLQDFDTATRENASAERKRLTEEGALFREASDLMAYPDTYGRGLAIAQSLDTNQVMNFPSEWTPEVGERMQQMALTAADKVAQFNANRTFNQNAVGKTVPFPENVQQQRTENSKASRSSVTVGTGEKEENKAYGQDLVDQYKVIRETADNANNELNNLQTLKHIDVNTGALEPAKVFMGRWALALGISEEALNRMGLNDIYEKEGFVGVAENLVLTKMQAQKGPQTENDAKRIAMTVASLKHTPKAKEFLLDVSIALRRREVEQADFYDRWRDDKDTFKGARKAWNHYKEITPLMGTNKNSKVPVFYQQYKTAMQGANPGASDEQILNQWRKDYGN